MKINLIFVYLDPEFLDQDEEKKKESLESKEKDDESKNDSEKIEKDELISNFQNSKYLR